MTAAERAARSAAADTLCQQALAAALPEGSDAGLALVAVGGYGRGELAPYSDLDVVLVHEDEVPGVEVAAVAGAVWYPLWDAGVDLDHSVRALSQVTAAAREDPRVALGLLDARHLAGDPNLTLRLRTALLAHWRRDARRQLPDLRALVAKRADRVGELAHASVPDLKESLGGLRDATVLKALVATWLVDVPHVELERSRQQLLDVRDRLHEVAGRATDRVPPEAWPELAERLGLPGPEAAQRHVRELGRRITHLSRLTWRRVEAVLARPPVARPGGRAAVLVPAGPGVAVSAGEVVLDRGTDPESDPLLLLRAAAVAAERRLVLNPATAARLAAVRARVEEPWDAAARDLLVRLLAAGPGLLEVWETLDETGALRRILPEWDRVRLLPHASVVHRFTVDRHLVETCIEASRLIRRVGRPDLLMVAALLHDIGKDSPHDHSVAGEPVAAAVAARIGLPEADCAVVARLVRRHLLLAETATTRDVQDPATVAAVAEQVVDLPTLELLATLTEADARATSAKAWTAWRANLVDELVRRTRARLEPTATAAEPATAAPGPVPVPERVRRDPGLVDVQVAAHAHGATVTVVSGDRIGLVADAAGALALLRVEVRSARVWTVGRYGISVWEVADAHLDPGILRQRFDAVFSGRTDPAERIRRPGPDALEPVVQIHHDASRDATVLEVRVADRPGLVLDVCRVLARLDVSVRSAHVSTLGPQAVDVFYLVEPGAAALSDERAATVMHAVRSALSAAATLDA